MTKQILSNASDPFLMAGQISKWLSDKTGKIDVHDFAQQLDKFVLFNEGVHNNSVPLKNLEKNHIYSCGKCFACLLYRKLSRQLKDEKLLYDFERRFLI